MRLSKICGRWLSARVIGGVLVVRAALVYGTEMKFTMAEGVANSTGNWLFGIFRGIVSFGLFGTFAYLLVGGYFTKSLDKKWIQIVGIVIFLILVNLLPTFYHMFVG